MFKNRTAQLIYQTIYCTLGFVGFVACRLRAIYPNLMKLSYDNTRTRSDCIIDAAENIQQKTPVELFEELYALQNNQPMSDVQRAFLLELFEAVWEERR